MDLEDPATLEKRAWRRQVSGRLWPGHTEEAVDLYITAGNLYKHREQARQAADCYLAAVELLKSGPDVEDYSLEAGKLYLGLELWDKSIAAYRCGVDESIKSRSRKAAWALKDMAVAYKHLHRVDQAKDALEQASALFFSTGQTLQGTKCMLEMAELVARRAKHAATFGEAAVAYDHAFGVMEANGIHVTEDMRLRRVFCGVLANPTSLPLPTSVSVPSPSVPPVPTPVPLPTTVPTTVPTPVPLPTPVSPTAPTVPTPEASALARLAFAIKSNDEDLFTQLLYQWDKKHRMSDTSLQLSLRIKRQFEENELL